MWNFKKEVEEARKPELLANMKKNLEALVGVVPGLLSVNYVAEPLSTSTHEFALVTTLEKVEETEKERLANICKTYGSQITADKAYVNGKVVTEDDTDVLLGIIDEDGMFKSGEICTLNDGILNCIIADETYYHAYVCNTNEYNKATRSEVKANLLISTACTLVDNEGNYTNSTNNTSCSSYTCTVNVDGKDYSKSCR